MKAPILDRKSQSSIESYCHTFPALRGLQAGKEFYVSMCPLRILAKMFLFTEEELPAKLRAQRKMNRARIPQIARYIVDNPRNYVFSSITASVDTSVRFEPLGDSDSHTGRLHIPMSARCVINDGQHRRAAIEEALKLRPDLADENISVVFFIDRGLKRSQQMFADLNKHAVRPTRSLGVLYEQRDPLSQLARRLSAENYYFHGLTETEKTTISNRSINLFTLSSIHQATQRLLRKKGDTSHPISAADEKLAVDFWKEVGDHIPEWRLAVDRKVASATLRKEYIHAHGIALQALAISGADLIRLHPHDWRQLLSKIEQVDWSRHNSSVWEGRATIAGKVSKAHSSVTLTANVLKKAMDLPLDANEQAAEQLVSAGRS